MLVDDKDLMGKLGPMYRECLEILFNTIYKAPLDAAKANPDAPQSVEFNKMYRSAKHLADHFEDYPLLLLGFNVGDPTGGSIFPSIWSAMLAARAEGVGSAITSVLMFKKDELFELLGVPADGGWNFACLVTMGYPTGRWGVAPRRPVHEVSYRNQWGTPVGFELTEPLWSPDA
jgi:nitroreductase